MEFLKQLAKPSDLGNNISNNMIFGLGTITRHNLLPFGRPRNQIVTHENGIPRGGSSSVETTGPVSI